MRERKKWLLGGKLLLVASLLLGQVNIGVPFIAFATNQNNVEQSDLNEMVSDDINNSEEVNSTPEGEGGTEEEVAPTPEGEGGTEEEVTPTPEDEGETEEEVNPTPEGEGGTEEEVTPTPEGEGGTEEEVAPTPEGEGGTEEEVTPTPEDEGETEDGDQVEDVNLTELPKSASAGLVQLWQVVPGGQTLKENVDQSTINNALTCKPNHNLYDNGGIASHDTYVNSCYVDDALYLGTSGSYINIYVAGYEGKVPVKESHYFDLDLNGDGKKVRYEIQTIARVIPASKAVAYEQEKVTYSDAQTLDYSTSMLDKYSLENEKSIEPVSSWTVKAPSYYANENGTLVHYLTNDVRGVSSGAQYGKAIVGKAPSWMKTNTRYYSYDGIYFYNNWTSIKINGSGAVNASNPFYNYYQWLPFRSTTNYKASNIDAYTKANKYTSTSQSKLVNSGTYFYNVQNKYGINSALQYAMGIHESGWGTSSLSMDKNNLFGMNATDNNPYGNGLSFPNVEAGINYHADRYLSWGYTDPVDDWRYMGSHVGNKGSGMNVRYASDPFWGEKIAGWYYRFDQNQGMKDYNYYSIGIKESDAIVSVKSQPNSSSSTLYTTKNGSNGLKIYNYPVLITGESNGYYKVQTDTPIVNGKPVFSAKYDFDTSKGYVPKSSITEINHTQYKSPTKIYVGRMMSLTYGNGVLNISGYGEVSGLQMPTAASVRHEIVLVNKSTNKEYKYPMTAVYNGWLAGDPHNLGGNYGYGEFKGNINISSLPFGQYDMYHQMTVSGQTHRNLFTNSAQLSLPTNVQHGNQMINVTDYKSGDKYPIQLTKTEVKGQYIGRMIDLKANGSVLTVKGYGEIAGLQMPTAASVKHEVVFVNKSTKKEYKYPMTAVYSSFLAGDPHDLGGNYAYGEFKGEINTSSLPFGQYDMYHQMTVSGQTHRNLFSNSAQLSLPKNVQHGNQMINVTDYKSGDKYPIQLTKTEVKGQYIGRMIDLKANGSILTVKGYGEISGLQMPTAASVKHEVVFVNKSTKKEYKYPMTAVYSSWLAGDPHNLGGNYAYGEFKGDINISSLPFGQYDMYHQMTISGQMHRNVFTNSAQLSLPTNVQHGNQIINVTDYKSGDKYPIQLTKTEVKGQYIGRMIDLKANGSVLTVKGYGEIAGLQMPTAASVKHEIVFVNKSTKKEYKYPMTAVYSSWLAGDPHDLGGTYAYGEFKGNINLSNLPVGDYDMYHQMTISGQTHRKQFVNNALVSLPSEFKVGDKSVKLSHYKSGTNYPIQIKKY